MLGFFRNKKSLKKIGIGLVLLAMIALLFIILTSQTQVVKASHGKADQFYTGNKTCENFIQIVNWAAVGTKSAAKHSYYNWTIGTDSPSQKDKDIISIYTYARYISTGSKDAIGDGEGYCQIANHIEGYPPADWTDIRYAAYLNELVDAGTLLGPRWECGTGGTPDSCDTTEQGFNNISQNYSVHVYGHSMGNPNKIGITDIFNIKYDWCWTPIIYDANVSQETGGWGILYNFTIKVTNPGATTTVYLWRRSIGQTWQQIGNSQQCADCAQETLNWTITNFDCSDIGDWEFKFNATDNQGYSTEAGDSLTTGGIDECLDSGNDCVFSIGANDINYTVVGVEYSSGEQATETAPATLKLQAYDLTKGTSSITESLQASFRIETSESSNNFNTDGQATSNSVGEINYVFTPDPHVYSTGTSKWFGETFAATTCYVFNQSANSIVNINVEEVGTPPTLQDEKVNGETFGATAGWGSNWTFTVNVTNTGGVTSEVNVTLQVNTGGGLVDIETQTCDAPCDSLINMVFYVDNFSCLDISSASYRFRGTNIEGSAFTNSRSFTIDKDTIIFEHIAGNNSISNRSGSQSIPLTLRVFDTDKAPSGEYISDGTSITFSVHTGTSYFTHSSYIIETNETGHINFDFNPSCSGDFSGAPKFIVGDRNWKAETLSSVQCYKAVTSNEFNTSIRGDILLDFVTPKPHYDPEGQNFTQEQTITFLGATTDDCKDALVTSVVYNANISASDSFECPVTEPPIGANAFQCIYTTTTATTIGWYNTTMFANVSYHYDNSTQKTGDPGLFYLFPLRRLAAHSVVPTEEYYYYPNWQFNVTATSGDDIPMRIELFLKKGGGGFENCSSLYQCVNITMTDCINCQAQNVSWLKNFTQSDVGAWFYQIKMINNETEAVEAQTAGTDNFLVKEPTAEEINFFDIWQSPPEAQWGGTKVEFNVTINTTITDNNLTVYAWNSLSTGGPWTLVGTGTFDNETGGNQVFNFSKNTNTSDIGTNYYFFNATDGAANTGFSSTGNYLITKDYINMIYLVGDAEISNRSGNQYTLLSFQAVNANGSVMGNFPIKYSVTTNNLLAYHTDNNFIVLTNSTGYANFNFNATCSGEYPGAPKFLVGEQKWKAQLNDSLLNYYFDNETSDFLAATISVRGDINLTFNTPEESDVFTQEQAITFLGATTDDCGDALVATVIYYANTTDYGFECPVTEPPIGANAFKCDYTTTLSDLVGYYNTTMFANYSFHYTNFIENTGDPGLFYLGVKRRLDNPTAVPTSAGWGYPNWNFSIVASSGDPTITENITLHMGTAWPPGTPDQCNSTTCVNGTSTICEGCQDALTWWLRNFSSSDVGKIIYYRFKLGDYFEDTIKSVKIEKDNTNISYGGSGDGEVVTLGEGPKTLKARVYDIDAGRFELAPAATVNFKLLHENYDGGEKSIGSNTTNASGYAEFNFAFNECEGWQEGSQKWIAEIDSSESNYNISRSENFTITLVKIGCVASIEIAQNYTPKETFQNKIFTVNATITAWQETAENVWATLNLSESSWLIENQIQDIGTVGIGSYKPVTWNVNATTSGIYYLSIYANSTTSGNASKNTSEFIVYKEYPSSSASDLPVTLESSNETILSWDCNVSDYRIASLNLGLNGTTTFRVYTYNGLKWKDILHSQYIDTNSEIIENSIPILGSQIFPNSTDSCLIKVKNLGDNELIVDIASLEAHHDEKAKIQDIIAKVGNTETTGIETSEELFNVSVKIANPTINAYTINIQLNITNSSGSVIYNSTNSDVSLGTSSTITSNFTNIDTSSWNQGDYQLNSYVSGDITDSRTESFVFKDVQLSAKAGSDYMCTETTEWFNITFMHPFNDAVVYNVSLEIPEGWDYSGSHLVNAESSGNYSVMFDITSGSGEELAQINATINYTLAGINKLLKTSKSIENNNSIPIIEIVRESPKVIGKDTVFDAQLSVHNKGCASTSGTTVVKEIVSTGWTPANPSSLGEVTLISAETDLINNIVTWNLGTIGINKYAVLTYQVKSPNDFSYSGALLFNSTYGSRYLTEEPSFNIQTLDYSGEPHLQFGLETIQQGDFPWGETRSAQLNKHYNYSLEVKNIGGGTATGWNVTLDIPLICNVSDASQNNGNWNEAIRKIIWELPDVEKYSTYNLNFTLNCTAEGKQVLIARGVKDTIGLNYSIDDINLGCSGESCSTSSPVSLTKPSGARYEKMKSLDFYVFYNWSAYGLTIGEGMINVSDDSGDAKIIWQNYSHNVVDGKLWVNYTLDSEEENSFSEETRNIALRNYVAGTLNAEGNVTIEKIAYVWQTGKLFEENENLFIKVKTYEYNPLLTGEALFINGTSKTTGGWGETFYFNISVRDRFGRDVTVFLWHKKGAAAYTQVGNWTCENCGTSTEANFTYNYQGDDMGSWTFKFNSTNPDGGEESSENTYTIEEDDLNADYFIPAYNVTINRSQLTDFVIDILDTDNSSYPGYLVSGATDEGKGKIYISLTGKDDYFDSSPAISSNSTGSLTRQMQNQSDQWCDTANYYLGQNWWYGGVSGASRYKENLTSIRPFMLKADLYNYYMEPSGTNYTSGSVIPLKMYVYDDCNINVTSGTTVIFNLSTTNYSTTQQVTYDSGSETYRKTDYTLPGGAPLGWYNITVTSTKTNHWNGTVTQTYAFYYGSAVELTGQQMQPSGGGGWGESPFTFNVTMNNNQTTTIFLWLSNSSSGEVYEYNETCATCNNYVVSYDKNFTCGNIDSWTFRYNASDIAGFTHNSLSNISFNVEKDDNTIDHYQGNDSNVNRSSGITRLAIQINDTDAIGYTTDIDNATELFTYIHNGSAWITESEYTNTTGNYYYLDFNPGCNYEAGTQNWQINISSAICYKNQSSATFVMNIYGDLNNTITSPIDTNFTQGDNILFRGYVIDDCNVNMTSLTTAKFNVSNGTVESYDTNDEGNSYYNYTWDSTGKAAGWWNVTFYTGENSYNQDSVVSSFYLSATQALSSPSVSPSSGGWGVPNYTYSVTVTDEDVGDTVNVSLWMNKDGGSWTYYASDTCTDCSSTVLSFNRSYSNSDIGNWSFKFNSTDSFENTYEINGGWHDVDKDTISVGEYQGDNVDVNRSDSQPGNSARIAGYVYDSDSGSNTTSVSQSAFYTYITNDTSEFVEQSETINATGEYYYVDFNPDCNYTAAQQSWKMNVTGDSSYKNASSSIFSVNVYGNANASYTTPIGLVVYERGDSILFYGNVTDDCGNVVTDVDAQYQIVGSTTYYCNETAGYNTAWSEDSGQYNCTWDSSGRDISNYNITMLISKSYHNAYTDSETDAFRIKATPMLEDASIDIDNDGWGVPRTFSINVTDNAGDNVTVQLWQDLGTGYELVGTDFCNVTCDDYVINFTIGYSCNEKGTGKKFKFNSTDTEGNSDETGETTFIIDEDNVLVEYVFGNESTVNLLNSSEFIVRVYDIDNQTYNLVETATVTFNVTKTGLRSTQYNVGTNTTNSSGYARFFFTPDQTFGVQKQDWLGYVDTQNCYEYNTTIVYNVTTLTNAPQLVNETVDIISDGWGIQRTFNITVKDTNNTANVSLYRASSLASPDWILMNYTDYTDVGNWQTLSLVQTFDTSLQGIWYFKFNASNEVGNINTTATVSTNNFTLEKNDIYLTYLTGHDSVANRSGGQTTLLSFRVQNENGTYLSNFAMRFSVQSDAVNYFTDTYFVVNTNSSGYANFNFNATCLGDMSGAPKFLVGSQNWKISINDSELGDFNQNDSSSFLIRNLSVQGDIQLDFSTPDGSSNFTQENTITFLGATTDDCGDALVTTVVYDANSTTNSFQCTDNTQIGANAFQCVFQTYLNTTRGYYNVTMNANKADHYDNSTSNTGNPGLFYILPKKKLVGPVASPTVQGWGYPNWNFSVVASSGDPDNNLTGGLYMDQSVNPTSQCVGPTCVNQTTTSCNNCEDKLIYWLRNFTDPDPAANTIGTWYYQFKLDDAEVTSTSGTDFSVVVQKDDTNITYGGAGNDTTVTRNSNSEILRVRVYDQDKGSYNVTLPSATVVFKLLHSNYVGGEKIIGINTTNNSGYADFNFSFTECSGWEEGAQKWVGEINSSEANYNTSISENFTITLSLPGCEAAVDAYSVITPSEVFQNKNFTTNGTVTAWISSSSDVYAILNTSETGWTIYDQTQYLGTVGVGAYEKVTWQVNPATTGSFNMSLYANSSDAGNDTEYSSYFTVYKEKPETSFTGMPILLDVGEEAIKDIACEAGDYRIATLKATWNTSAAGTKVRIYVYNNTEWKDILHSLPLNTSGSFITSNTPILQNQLYTNETERCRIKIKNIGTNNGSSINITALSLETYFKEAVKILDIIAKTDGNIITGLEPDAQLFNVTVKIANSINQNYTETLWLNITNSSGYVVNSSSQSVNITANTTAEFNFTNINTSSWSEDIYTLKAYLSYNGESTSREKPFTYKYVIVTVKSTSYICNQTTEQFNVTIVNPFINSMSYNVSLQVPTGWNYVPNSQIITATEARNYTASFNLTSGPTADSPFINATVNYTFNGGKTKNASKQIENGVIPILEVIREAPSLVANRTEFVSKLAVYNKGCADASSVSFVEIVSTGWTAYSSTMDGSSAGVSDIPEGEIRFDSNDFGTIRAQDYRILAYKVLPPTELSETGTFRYNLTWGSRNNYEDEDFEVNTTRYIDESHLSFDLKAIDSFKDRSAEKDENQFYEFNITNIGDYNIINLTWNVTLKIPSQCNASNYTGTYNAGTRKIIWNLGILNVSDTNSFNFNMNCTTEDKYTLSAEGINNTISTTTFTNDTNIGCTGEECSNTEEFSFIHIEPYERHTKIDFYISYNWTGYGLTIGEGYVNMIDDQGTQKLVWQNYSFSDTSGKIWANYTISDEELENFIEHERNISIWSHTDATDNSIGNITIEKIVYIWQTGKLFSDSQSLFVDIHPFVYELPTPVLEAPANDSLQAAIPVGLSWQAISPPQGINITYYVFGDNIDASTLLDSITDALYLWRDLISDTYYWRVVASDGTSNESSVTWQFDLDLCQPDPTYSYALNYSMSYNNVTDTITVWGNNGSGSYTAMGNNESNAITFEQIYEFGKAKRGICAVIKPATGSYAVLSRLELGNTSSLINTTYVSTSGESIDFSKQFQLNFNSTLISGELTAGGIAQAGSTLSFSGLDANESEQGQFYLLEDSELRLYDTGVSHKTTANNSNPFRLYWTGDVKAKSSTLQNWYTIRFLGNNNTLDNINIINMGEGFYPATTQIGTLSTIKPGNVDTGGLVLAEDSNVTITALEVSEATNDILVINYTGIANLINPTLNFSNINWTTGTFGGSISRKYDYTPTIIDAIGDSIENTSLVLKDLRGDTIFDLTTDSSGTISTQTITRVIYDYTYKTGDERGPHTLKVKKFGKNFQTLAKQFSALTVETLQMSNNPFVTLTESQVLNLSGIFYYSPTKVNYGDDINSSWTTTGTLNNSPVTQSEFFSVFANGTKLVEGASNNYTINYETGVITFNQDMTGYDVYPVYSYGGNITIATGTDPEDCISMSDIYSYMQYNLSEVLQTVDGSAYTSYIDLIIGNDTTGGCIVDSEASLTFEDGYTYSFSTIGGYIDLYGVTAGSGIGGGHPLSIYNDVGTTYEPGDTVYIFSTTLDSSGALITSTIDIIVYYPNDTIISSGTSTQSSEPGRYAYNFTLTGSSPEGTYRVDIDADDGTNEVHDNLVFQVSIGGGGGSANPEVLVEAPNIITTNANFSITALTKSDSGVALNCDSTPTITIRDTLLGTNIVLGASMTNFATGQYNYTWSAENESSFLATVVCTMTATYTGTTSFSTLGVPIEDGFVVDISDVGEVAVGHDYYAKIWIYDNIGNPIDADTTPTLTLMNPNGVPIMPNTAMTWNSTGVYTYTFDTTGYTAGTWESIVNVTVNNITVYPSEFWELEAVYADVSNPTITDNTVPLITATTYISNNGTTGSDFEIAYCIVTTPENVCGGADDIDTATKTEYFESKEIRLVTLDGVNVPSSGDYYFRVQVRPVSATEVAWGLSSFTATSAAVTLTPPGGGGGGGGGAVIIPAPTLSINPEYIQVKLSQGEKASKNIILTNKRKENLTVSIENPKLKDFIEISETNFMLEAGETKVIVLKITANEDSVPDLYIGNLIINAKGMKKEFLIMIEVKSKKPLFDINLKIPKKHQYVSPGEDVSAEISIYNLVGTGEVDIFVEYTILNRNGDEILHEQEPLVVETSTSFVKVFKLPENADLGKHFLYVKTTYNGLVASASASFNIGEKPFSTLRNILIIGAVLIIIFTIILYKFKKKKGLFKSIFKKKRKRQTLNDYKREVSRRIRK